MPKPDVRSVLASLKSNLTSPESEAATRAREFPLGGTRIHRQREADNRRHRARVRKLMRASNADALIREFPSADGDSTHALIPGDFEFWEILPRMVTFFGPPAEVHAATLSLSLASVFGLEKLISSLPECRFTLALSHFFQNTNKTIFRALENRLVPLDNFRLAIGRLHTKIILFRTQEEEGKPSRHFALETSANFRSSRNLEQVAVFQCPELFGFHLTWLRELHAAAESGENDHLVSFTCPAARVRTFS
jgi:hypothetical protein